MYVDKTAFVYKMAHDKKYYFLSRPRRFGKSLLLSTLDYFFRGEKDLFHGLAIESLEKEWNSFPVLHFDLSTIEADTDRALKADLLESIIEYEEQFGILPTPEEEKTQSSVGRRFKRLIRRVYEKTGKQVVVLIDEYDKGILDVIRDEKKLEKNRKVLRNFFTQLKASDKYLRFVMLTGVSRFQHLTIFSGLNNLTDISMEAAFSTICGITMEELHTWLEEGVLALAESQGTSVDDILEELKQKYDGYRFSSAENLVFNPYSLLKALDLKELGDYWMLTGTSRVFIDFLAESDFVLDDLVEEWYNEETLASIFDRKAPVPLLYQTGYLTISDSNKGLYQLTVPNGEVRCALMEQLMPLYMGISKNIPMRLQKIKDKILNGDIDGWLTELKSMIATAPYQLLIKDEGNPVERFYHLMIYQVFILLGIDTCSEINIAGGRIDMVAKTPKLIYVMEFKLDGTPSQALKQIDKKGYAIPFEPDGRQMFKIGVVFSSDTHTISKWKIQACS